MGKKKKQINFKSDRTTMHASPSEEEDTETNPMIRWKHD
jgi:hypothetical protein